MAEWHYIGNYGQLGPLKEDQMQELIEVGVIEIKTYVWREGMTDWTFAKDIEELRAYFGNAPSGGATPPPPPPGRFSTDSGPLDGPSPDPMRPPAAMGRSTPPRLPAAYHPNVPANAYVIQSDKSRVVAGVLNFMPGFGRFYLGYSAIGVLQLMLTPCFGIGWIWSIIDGVGILAGYCPEDGYGRQIVS